MTVNRNAVFDALLALGAPMTWGAGNHSFQEASRRFKTWDVAPQPSLYQVEGDEKIEIRIDRIYRAAWKATWVIYHNTGKDQSTTPAAETSDILDAVDLVFRPIPAIGRLTLGGLVSHTYIDGTVQKLDGALDGQAMIIIPITLILP